MGKFWNELKLALRDQTAGAIKHGASTSPGHNRRAMLAAKAEREERERRIAGGLGAAALNDLARRAFRQSQAQKGRDSQFEENGIKVRVKNGYSTKYDAYTTDIVVVDPGRRGEHFHIVFNGDGDLLHEQWTKE